MSASALERSLKRAELEHCELVALSRDCLDRLPPALALVIILLAREWLAIAVRRLAGQTEAA